MELIEENITAGLSDSDKLNSVAFEGLGNCTSRDSVLSCDNERIDLLIVMRNSSKILFHQVFEMAGIPIVVVATAGRNGGVWISTYNNMGREFHQIAGLTFSL